MPITFDQPRSRRSRRVGIAVATVAVMAGATATTIVTSGAAGASPGRASTTYTVSKTGMITGKKAQAPGRIEIAIAGAKGQGFQLVKSINGAGAAKLISDSNKLNSTGKSLALEHDFLLFGGAPVGETYWAYLKPGDYYAVDTNTDKPSSKGIKHIHVAGKVSNSYPPAFSRIQAVAEESWYGKPKTMPASGVIAFQNKAQQSHFIDLVRMKPGKTRADIGKALKGTENQGSVFYSGKSDDFESGVLSPDHTVYLSYDLKPGTWALLCFWPDRKTGMPHAFMGMYRTIVLK